MVFMVSILFYGGGLEDKLHHIYTVTFCHLIYTARLFCSTYHGHEM